MSRRLCLVGAGKMGGALLGGWLAAKMEPKDIAVVEPDPDTASRVRERFGVATVAGADALDSTKAPDAIVLAVKPQIMDEVAPRYSAYKARDVVFMSIAAGRTVASLERHLGADAAIVRAMPNTPAQVGRGISVAFANAPVTAAQRALCDDLLGAVGEVAWVDDEALLDPVTAVSGSGPGYVFLFIECLAQAGAEAGLPDALAMRLARATVIGAGELARRSDEPADRLRQNVTSPGGTTEAALEVLMARDGLRQLLGRAVEAATARSKALAR